MLGETITLNLGTIADPENVVLKRINQDGYSAEYRLKDTDREHVVLIRHTKETAKLKGNSVDRHNVTYTQNIFPSDVLPQGETRQAYTVIRANPAAPNLDTIPLVNAVTQFTIDFADEVLNWES
jgi:hypothetical protein